LNIAQEDPPELERYAQVSEMPPWFQVFYAQYIRQREDLRDMISVLAKSTAGFAAAAASRVSQQPEMPAQSYMDFNDDKDSEDPYNVDPAKFRLMNLNITLLEGGILFHSIFVGMTISITSEGFITLLVAIIFHQFFEGLGLGSRIAAVPYKPRAAKPWILVVAFGTTCPIGQAIGLATRDSYDQGSAFALILVGFFNAL
jgi:solute carrier family 39 (zinc transporter), member 1/2/3